MKKAIVFAVCLAAVFVNVCWGEQKANVAPLESVKEENKMSMEKTYQFIKEAKVYYLATVDGDQPHVRPFGTVHIFEGRLYIQTGRKKNVAKQLLANGKAEIVAMKGNEWIRVTGVLVEDNRREPKASMLEAYPQLKGMYSADDDNTMVLYFKPGTVTSVINSMGKPPVEMKF